MQDAHNHLQDPRFESISEHVIATMLNSGITRCVVNGTSPADWPQVAELSVQYPGLIIPSFGLHPWQQTADTWHEQLVAHLDTSGAAAVRLTNAVDGDDVPIPPFGVLLEPAVWGQLAEQLTAGGVEFMIKPHTRFTGEVGEQSTMFFLDPSGNALEFKSFTDDDQVFAN